MDEIQVDARGTELGPRKYDDGDGYVMPIPAGTGPRRIPLGDFPTGPPVGSPLPPVRAEHASGPFDVHADRNGNPAVLVFFRSVVW